MTAPNLIIPAVITGKTAVYACTASLGSALENSADSDKVLKVNTIRAANISTSAGTVDVTFYRSSTDTHIVKSAPVPVNSSFVVTDKNEYVYLEEGDSIRAKANATDTIELTIHYEEVE